MPRGFWWIVEGVAVCAYLAVVSITLSNYSTLPAVIPTHFGLSGQPDGFGGKATILLVAAASTVLFGMLSAAPFFPNLINVPGARTPEALAAAIAMLRALKVEVMLFMAFLAWAMVQTALGARNGLGGVAPLGFIVILLTTIGIGMYKSTRDAN